MDTLERQIILNLKSRFFDIIDTENGFFHYEKLLNEMLSAIQALTEAGEITLCVFNEWKQEFFAEASTNPEALDSRVFSGDLKRW
ncbi:GGDEF domain-containing protein, partial [Diaphorobacter sp. DS2]